MPMVRKEGKDTIIFASKEEHATPSKIDLPEPEPGPGLILPNGEINWNCPCLGGMATGPCGLEFREAFSCFHYSTSDPKGSDCYEAFKTMQVCMLEYPSLYGKKTDQMDLLDEDATDKLEDSDHMAERKQDRTSSALSKVEENSTQSSQKEGAQSVAN